MKLFCLALLSACLLTACSTVIDEVVIPLPPSDVNFHIARQVRDSAITLQWDAYPKPHFKEYEIVREHEEFKNGYFVPVRDTIKSFHHPDSVTFTDTSIPFSPRISYYLVVRSGTVPDLRDTVSFTNPQQFYNNHLRHVIIDRKRHVLYMIGYNQGNGISIYDYIGDKVVRSAPLFVYGYMDYNPDAGTNGELYVGTRDGWLLILDPVTLQEIDKIYVMGNQVLCVQSMNGLMAVTTSDLLSTPEVDYNRRATKVYRRSTKELLSYVGHWSNARMLHLPGATNRVIEMLQSSGSTMAWSIRLDANGQILQETMAGSFEPRMFYSDILHGFPSGQKFITGSAGWIYNDKLELQTKLGASGQFADFAINADESIIYAADNTTNTVKAIRLSDNTELKSYPYKALMYNLFIDGDRLVMISSYYQDPIKRGNPPFIFETVKL